MNDWRGSAACLGQIELMFDVKHNDAALELCQTCPVLEECHTWASTDRTVRDFMVGVVGGKAYRDRGHRLPILDTPAPSGIRVCRACERYFEPAHGNQRVCSEVCRHDYDNRLASKRKARYLAVRRSA